MLASSVLSILLGAWCALLILFRSLRKNLDKVDAVMGELHRGNLKARIPVDRDDEIGRAMVRFNRMTDEIERLVEHLRGVEKSRMTLLQELAHDLRTPVASLRNLVEIVQKKDAKLDGPLRAELLDLAAKEIDYFGRLVEDLLVLAQIDEPNYKPVSEQVRLEEVVEEAAEAVDGQFALPEHVIKLTKTLPSSPTHIQGDVHLLRRMFRNALVNAYTHAWSEVSLTLEVTEKDEAVIRIEDDGPGFTQALLADFGERRMGRTLARDKDGILRAGLGALILKKIALVHQGSVQVTNRPSQDGKPGGACVEITLPVARKEHS
jgi:signal transduction histidine kinase